MDLLPPQGPDGPPYPLQVTTLSEWMSPSPAGEDSVWIDLSMVSFIDALGLAVVAAVAEDAALAGRTVKFTAPTKVSVRNYMSRMHVGDCLSRYCSVVDLPNVKERDTAHRLSELERFEGGSGDELAESVFQALRTMGKSQSEAGSFFKGVSEVVGNVVEHSGVSGGWAAMQVMPPMITFAVADAGAGLEATLSRHNEVDGPVDAMEKAFQRSVSGTGSPGRGTGLDDLLQRVRRHRGELRAWSGGASGRSAGGPIACREVNAPFPGTVIYAGFRPELREGC